MVAPNTQLSPLQQHSKSLSTLTSSLKNYSRIQSEVEREGFEVHKENLLSFSLSRKKAHSEAGEQLGASVPSSSQTGPLHTYRKTALQQSVLPAVLGSMSHGCVAQPHEQGAAPTESILSCERTRLLASGTSDHLLTRAASSSFSGLHPPVVGEEANNAYRLYGEMFPQVYTPPMSACLATSLPQNQEFKIHPCTTVEHVKVGNPFSIVGNVETEAGGEGGNVKRLKYTSFGEDGTSMRLLGCRSFKQGFASCGAIDGRRASTAEDAAHNVCVDDVGSFDLEAKSRGCVATLCGTTEFLKAPGLKLFTTSVHVQMPKALMTFSEGEPFLPLSLEHSQQQASTRLQKTPVYEGSCADADWGKFLALSATPIANDDSTANEKVLPFQQRFKQLQAFLKQCDEADQIECMHALRSLSAAARSGHAVELETRAIRLSLEEGKEMKRMRLLNVLGKISERSLEDAGATPQGPRLPAPGVAVKFMNVPP